jgi:UDP:flavonoid glycosyltransferase YjiC (YdhE family)
MAIAAKKCHKPLITVIQADLHPQNNGFIWWKQPISGIPTPVSAINKILAEYQLQPINKTDELLIGDLTLIIGTPETDPLPNTAEFNYIGAILWQKENEKLPDWILNLRKDQPVIWLYPGNPNYIPGYESPFDSKVILHACIQALKDMPVQVVLSTGHQFLPKSVLPLPANFRHTSFVPGLAMAERSDLMIHHGGYGSCQTGLYTGTPAVIIPTYSERESNARRIAALGAGVFVLPTTDASGRKKKVDVEELRAKIEHVLSDPSYKENAKKISERMRRYGGEAKAVDLIENFIHGLSEIKMKNK